MRLAAWLALCAWGAGLGVCGEVVEVDAVDAEWRGNDASEDPLQWLQRHGGSAHGAVDVADFNGMGRGLRCTRALSEDGAVLSVPKALVFNGKDLIAKFGASKLAQDDAIAVALLAEVARGSDSLWAVYLKALPTEVRLALGGQRFGPAKPPGRARCAVLCAAALAVGDDAGGL
jgi:hypothetical protein